MVMVVAFGTGHSVGDKVYFDPDASVYYVEQRMEDLQGNRIAYKQIINKNLTADQAIEKYWYYHIIARGFLKQEVINVCQAGRTRN